MTYLPNEIVNIILSYVERPKTAKLIKYLIEECYLEDFNDYYTDNYCFMYSFQEWYFLYRYHFMLGGKRGSCKKKLPYFCVFYSKKFKYTPEILLIGSEIIGSER